MRTAGLPITAAQMRSGRHMSQSLCYRSPFFHVHCPRLERCVHMVIGRSGPRNSLNVTPLSSYRQLVAESCVATFLFKFLDVLQGTGLAEHPLTRGMILIVLAIGQFYMKRCGIHVHHNAHLGGNAFVAVNYFLSFREHVPSSSSNK